MERRPYTRVNNCRLPSSVASACRSSINLALARCVPEMSTDACSRARRRGAAFHVPRCTFHFRNSLLPKPPSMLDILFAPPYMYTEDPISYIRLTSSSAISRVASRRYHYLTLQTPCVSKTGMSYCFRKDRACLYRNSALRTSRFQMVSHDRACSEYARDMMLTLLAELGETHTLTTIVPCLPKAAPFQISVHSWRRPRFSPNLKVFSGPNTTEKATWKVTVFIDGVVVS